METSTLTRSVSLGCTASVYSQAGWIELSDAFPPSTPDDAGKVLAVGSDGKPEWGEASGGGCLLITSSDTYSTITFDSGEVEALGIDKTYTDIKNAITNGIPIIFYNSYEDEYFLFYHYKFDDEYKTISLGLNEYIGPADDTVSPFYYIVGAT